jgi:uncharacterized protein YdiU (UPF0061 family)
MNQLVAAQRNYIQFANSLKPLLNGLAIARLEAIVEGFRGRSKLALDSMLASKLGFAAASPQTVKLWEDLQVLMEDSIDWTIFWRQLSHVVIASVASTATFVNIMVQKYDAADLLEILGPCFYVNVGSRRKGWLDWIEHYVEQLGRAGINMQEASALMRSVSPKYIPREWMLVKAYSSAQEEKNYSTLHELVQCFERPYDEQPEFEEAYYLRAPPTAENQGGTAFMS